MNPFSSFRSLPLKERVKICIYELIYGSWPTFRLIALKEQWMSRYPDEGRTQAMLKRNLSAKLANRKLWHVPSSRRDRLIRDFKDAGYAFPKKDTTHLNND